MITVDARALTESSNSGVSEYTLNILKEWKDKPDISLFSSGWNKTPSNLPLKQFHKKWPNKVLNLVQFVGLKPLDRLTGADVYWLPNLNFFKTRKPYIITIHDLSFEIYPEFFSPKMRLWHKALKPRKLISQAARVIAVSQNTKDDLVNLYKIPANKITVIHSGLADEFFVQVSTSKLEAIINKYKLPQRFVLSLGTIEPRKNIQGLIESFELFKRRAGPKMSGVQLIIGGRLGWSYQDVLETAKSVDCRNDIKFINYVDAQDLPGLYQLASLFVYPSFYEGFGFPPLEAAASQIPVISSYAGSLGEVTGDAALLVDPYNVNQLAVAMNEFLSNPPAPEDLRKIAQKIKIKYSWKKAAELTWQTIQTINNI